jgi:hypothetical protein
MTEYFVMYTDSCGDDECCGPSMIVGVIPDAQPSNTLDVIEK